MYSRYNRVLSKNKIILKTVKNTYKGIRIGVLFIGLGVVFLFTGLNFFPWILLLISICFIPEMFIKEERKKAFLRFYFFLGLFILFLYKIFWPGLLIFLGIYILLSSCSKQRKLNIAIKKHHP